MAGWLTRTRRSRGAVGIAAFLLVGAGQALAAETPAAPSATSRVRAADSKAADLLRAGSSRSTIFRGLVETIEQSDLVVYVETRHQVLPGQLNFVVANGTTRYVRISMRGFGLDNDILPWLAHELQHAVEVAGAPEVRSRTDLHNFYERIGGGSRTSGSVELETVAAQETQERVLTELRRGSLRAAR